MQRRFIDLRERLSVLGALGAVFLLSLSASAAPLGIFPGSTGLKEARALLGEPQKTLIEKARYLFSPPQGSGYAGVELYIGRQSGVVEIAEFLYETPADPAPIRSSLGQKAADLSYPRVAGGTREVFLAQRVSLLLGSDGKARAISYLSGEALGLILSDLAPLKPDRSTPQKALLSLVAAFTAGGEQALKDAAGPLISADEVRTLLKRRGALLLLFDGFSAQLPKRFRGKKEITARLRQPLYGTAEFTFQLQGGEWLFSGLKLLEEGAPTSPRGAFEVWRDALLADGGGLSGTSVEAVLGASWRDILPRMELVGGWIEEKKGATGAVLLVSEPQARLVLYLARDGKDWRVTEVKERNP